ncbi:preprotein translocase subunit SecE [Buchnera aphidicola]|uniref:preprotein translocase subunit SecE n=1 Tax=Buchnera aphidicola TaxID=9 RepID=UPI003D18D18D
MNFNFYTQTNNKKIVKWLYILIIFITTVIINIYCKKIAYLYYILINFCLLFLFVFIILSTNIGKKILHFIISSKNETKKIIWPSQKETIYTTGIITTIIIIVSLIIWGLDNIIFRVISFIINLR